LCAVPCFSYLRVLRPPTSPPFPYTTLFRSRGSLDGPARRAQGIAGLLQGQLRERVRLVGGPRGERERRLAHGTSQPELRERQGRDRKSTRLNSSHEWISYAVFRLKKKDNRP